MAKDYSTMADSNRSSNPSIHDLSSPARRTLLCGGTRRGERQRARPIGGLRQRRRDGQAAARLQERAGRQRRRGHRPRGLTRRRRSPLREPVGLSGEDAPFRFDAGNTAAQQEAQLGMHHDGIHYYPLPGPADPNAAGLLVMNHEYVDDGPIGS